MCKIGTIIKMVSWVSDYKATIEKIDINYPWINMVI
jgi:hypothetical protein